MEGNEKITFWELLDEYSIEIPVIQRDYAQGRENVEDIRNNFLESIKNALDTKTDLDLNFVYGSANGKLYTYRWTAASDNPLPASCVSYACVREEDGQELK